MKMSTVLALAAVIAVAGAPVRAQDEGGNSGQRLTRPRPLETILQMLTRNSGIPVVAESSLAGAQADYPRETATPQNLEMLLDKVVKSMPPGTAWKKAMLPTTTRFYRGDDVAAFLEVQSRLFGRAAEKPAERVEGAVEILGQKLAPEKAAPVVSTLSLKPVYVLVNSSTRHSDNFFTNSTGQTDFFNNFLGMAPDARIKFMQQVGQMFQSLSPEQRNQLIGGGIPANGTIRLSTPPLPPGFIPPK